MYGWQGEERSLESITDQDIVIRLVVSALLGGLVGFEREVHNRPAGLRTHMLVSVGSALLMVVSLQVANAFSGRTPADPARIAAQVVSGIGFLGAGTILREGITIRGLTTAASLWVVAALGLAAGAGFYVAAGAATLVTIGTLMLVGRFEKWAFQRQAQHSLRVRMVDRPGQLGALTSVLGRHRVDIRSIDIVPLDEEILEIVVFIQMPAGLDLAGLLQEITAMEGVQGLEHH